MEGLGIEDHSDDLLAPCTNDEGAPAGGVIYPDGGSLLPARDIRHGLAEEILRQEIWLLQWTRLQHQGKEQGDHRNGPLLKVLSEV